MNNLWKSIYFDVRLLSIPVLSFYKRLDLLSGKYIALLNIALGGKGMFIVGKSKLAVASIGDVGTIQSSIIDFYDDVVAANIISTSAPRILDVGANIGQFSSAAKLFYPDAKITAFEPDPEVFKILSATHQNQFNVTLHNFGLGERNETKVFYRNRLSAMSSFVNDSSVKKIGTVSLPLKTLDSPGQKQCDLLKIDAEGYELEVLNGARNTLKATSYLLVELSLDRKIAHSNLEILNFIYNECPRSHIIKLGRPLGNRHKPSCQDVLLKLNHHDNI